jgi:hypothetical protein
LESDEKEILMPESVVVDGATSLDDQGRRLNFYQQQKLCKISNYEKDIASSKPQNIATSQELPLGSDVPALHLIVIAKGGSTNDVQPLGTTLSFDNIVFVNAVATRVAGFHDS